MKKYKEQKYHKVIFRHYYHITIRGWLIACTKELLRKIHLYHKVF